jgi:hypothetical protein
MADSLTEWRIDAVASSLQGNVTYLGRSIVSRKVFFLRLSNRRAKIVAAPLVRIALPAGFSVSDEVSLRSAILGGAWITMKWWARSLSSIFWNFKSA